MRKSALGKGLDALIPTEKIGQGYVILGIDEIKPNTYQPRKDFDEEAIKELASSIQEKGIIQPIVVRKSENTYEIIAGERRWRAAQRVGLTRVPVIIKDVSDREALELALVENLQREDLNPIEEAT
ncbi:MAG TPA: ParB/RepB/Spo0J family partition protein, partial [Thermodesulfobacteriota bacterium]